MLLPDLPCFYLPDVDSGRLVGDELTHARSSFRIGEGDELLLSDGMGRIARASITALSKTNADFEVVENYALPRLANLSLALGILKHPDRMEWVVEKCQEMGIRTVRFFAGDHSQKKAIALERLNRVAISALKQSRSAYLLKIEFAKSLDTALPAGSKVFFGMLETGVGRLIDVSQDSLNAEAETNLVIGPEGGLSGREVGVLRNFGATPVYFTTQRLRAETAAVVGCGILASQQTL